MKLHIRVSPAARKDIPALTRTIRFMLLGANTVKVRRIRGETWILVDAPDDLGDNLTYAYTTGGFHPLHDGVEE